MTIIEKINKFLKKKFNLFSINSPKALQIQDLKPIILILFMIIFSGVFFISYNLIHKKNKDNINHFKEITENNEFSNLANFFISKINSPYEEIEYVIKNNDTVEKILKKYKIRDVDIKKISLKLKEKPVWAVKRLPGVSQKSPGNDGSVRRREDQLILVR